MTVLDISMHYLGGVTMALLFLYGTRNHTISLIFGFIAFCVFDFSFGVPDFDWQLNILADAVKSGAIVYVISYAFSVIIYRIFPIQHFGEIKAK